ncbi:hypothetical protein DL93DRAFT_2075354, partial [Clavulina sp. PMI_390]
MSDFSSTIDVLTSSYPSLFGWVQHEYVNESTFLAVTSLVLSSLVYIIYKTSKMARPTFPPHPLLPITAIHITTTIYTDVAPELSPPEKASFNAFLAAADRADEKLAEQIEQSSGFCERGTHEEELPLIDTCILG